MSISKAQFCKKLRASSYCMHVCEKVLSTWAAYYEDFLAQLSYRAADQKVGVHLLVYMFWVPVIVI